MIAKERIPFRAPRFAATVQMPFLQRPYDGLYYDMLSAMTTYQGSPKFTMTEPRQDKYPTGAPLYSDGMRNDVRHCSKPCAPSRHQISQRLPNLELRALNNPNWSIFGPTLRPVNRSNENSVTKCTPARLETDQRRRPRECHCTNRRSSNSRGFALLVVSS